ncbi:MAG: DUF5666 domain-containing protein [Woeseiaceae bacterium]
MNTKLLAERGLHLLFAALLTAALLTACSGGGVNIEVEGPDIGSFPPLQTEEAIEARGTITGLGGVTINGVRYLTNNATVTMNGAPGTLSDLRHGQIVTVTGRIESGGSVGTANHIDFDANIIGPVENLDPPGRQLMVMGQTVRVDPDTSFHASIDPATFSGLTVGSMVSVSGYTNAAGAIDATRIDVAATNAELRLIGEVADLDLASLVFRIKGLTVDYSNALVIDLPGGAPADGMDVNVIGSMSGGLFVVERIEAAPSLTGNDGLRVQTAGIITRYRSTTDFDINGAPATVNAATVYINGDASDLGLNTELVMDGNLASDGRIMADRVTIGHAVSATVTLEYSFRDFTEITVPTVFNVSVTQGSDFSVEVVVDAEVSDRIDVTQAGSNLNIALITGDGRIETLEAIITMPVLERLDLDGVANATLYDFDQAQMDLRVAGVSQLIGSGLTIDNLTAEVSGVSRLDIGDVRPIGYAAIDISGVSQATLNMDVGAALTGSVNTGQGTGVSTLFYFGTDVAIDVSTDGLSSVVRLGATRP